MTIFAECIKRLYRDKKINKEKVMELYKNGKITEVEKNDILNAH